MEGILSRLGLARVRIIAQRFDSAKLVFSLMEMPAANIAAGCAEDVDHLNGPQPKCWKRIIIALRRTAPHSRAADLREKPTTPRYLRDLVFIDKPRSDQDEGTNPNCTAAQLEDPAAGQQPQQPPEPVPTASAPSAAAPPSSSRNSLEAEDLKRRDLLQEVDRILRIHERAPSDWKAVLDLRAGWSPAELDNIKRTFLLKLHPDKAFGVVESPEQQGRIRTAFDAMRTAHAAAKEYLQRPRPSSPSLPRFRAGAAPPAQPGFRPRPPSGPHHRPLVSRRCAHPMCCFAVTFLDFGGFCCKKCHLAFTVGGPPEHGRRCEHVDGQAMERSAPCPPANPMRPAAPQESFVV